MKFTSEDFMQWLGLKVGDRVKCIFMGVKDEGLGGQILELKKSCKGYISLIGEDKCQYPLSILLNRDIEILPRPKRVGDLECIDNCKKCPIRYACNVFSKNIDIDFDCGYPQTRYIALDLLNIKDQEIYDLLKKKLDKEVV